MRLFWGESPAKTFRLMRCGGLTGRECVISVYSNSPYTLMSFNSALFAILTVWAVPPREPFQ